MGRRRGEEGGGIRGSWSQGSYLRAVLLPQAVGVSLRSSVSVLWGLGTRWAEEQGQTEDMLAVMHGSLDTTPLQVSGKEQVWALMVLLSPAAAPSPQPVAVGALGTAPA